MVNQSRSVLVVDDDAVSRMLLRHMLERQGFEVVDTDSVDAATVALADNEIDIIICDYLMPNATGLDLLASLPDPHQPFILLTGELRKDDLNDDRVDAVTTYLTKPVGTDELAATLGVIVDQLADTPV